MFAKDIHIFLAKKCESFRLILYCYVKEIPRWTHFKCIGEDFL